MYYEWEWLSDLAIIPAWECFLVGVIVGAIITLAIIRAGAKAKGEDNNEQQNDL